MKIYNLIEVNELDLDNGASVSVYPFATEGSAIKMKEDLVAETKENYGIGESNDWNETEERTSYTVGDSDGRRYMVFIEESEVQP